jgi:riboflavin biosynthesis pyrimidine reductase
MTTETQETVAALRETEAVVMSTSGKAEAKAAYMRAKWARERSERSIERLIADKAGSDALKAARSLLQERKVAEAKAKKAYEAAKAAK